MINFRVGENITYFKIEISPFFKNVLLILLTYGTNTIFKVADHSEYVTAMNSFLTDKKNE